VSSAQERVLLVSMPFGALERPSPSLGLLQAHCTRLGVRCTTRYLTFAFAEWIGIADYSWLDRDVPDTAFAGEWVFAEALYGPRLDSDAAFTEDVLRTWALSGPDVDRILRIRSRAAAFIEHCLETVDWGASTFVGFTSTFQRARDERRFVGSARRPREDAPFAFDFEADVAIEPEGLLVLGLHAGGERGRAAGEKLGERVQHERAAEAETARGAGDGELLNPPAPRRTRGRRPTRSRARRGARPSRCSPA